MYYNETWILVKNSILYVKVVKAIVIDRTQIITRDRDRYSGASNDCDKNLSDKIATKKKNLSGQDKAASDPGETTTQKGGAVVTN